jgi:hypothetical protein
MWEISSWCKQWLEQLGAAMYTTLHGTECNYFDF